MSAASFRYFLDTNICIGYLRGVGTLKEKVDALMPDDIKISSIVKAELLYGVEKSVRRDRGLWAVMRFLAPYEIVPFDDAACSHYGAVRADLDRKGCPIGPNDLLIASIVLSRGGVLVRGNVREFRRIEGLLVENWR